MKKIVKAAVFALAALSAATSHAAIVYENGSHSTLGNEGGNNPFSFQNAFVAMDFTLGSATTLGGLTFNAFTTGATQPISNVAVNIYANAGGNVGAQMFSGNFGLASQQVSGNAYGYTLIDYSVNLPNWSLNAGTYWVGLQVDPAQWDMHWSIVSTIGYDGMISGSGNTGSYSNYGYDHYFSLSDSEATNNNVPEPASIALLGLGLAGLGGMRRKQKIA